MSEIRYEKPLDPRFNDITGKRFGRLVVDSFSFSRKNKSNKFMHYWNCFCDCGNEVSVLSRSLVSGATVSCGCYNKEKMSAWSIKNKTTHGLSKHTVYKRAEKQIQRCHNPNHKDYHLYGARGIKVCQIWRNDIGLMTQDILRIIGEPPTKYHQLDRPDNNRGYEPTNICWKTPEENVRNRRNSHNQSRDPATRKQTPTYNIWTGMIRDYYFEVCIEWKSDGNCNTDNGFKNFYRDMGEKPRYRSPIKRHDESKPFCKSNCYWG